MSKLHSLNPIVSLIAALVTIATAASGVLLFLKKQGPEIQLLIITIAFLVLLLLANLYTIWILRELLSPKKPRLVKARDYPETYIFYQNQWRFIPDPPTRDYLAYLLGFRPGEDDIAIKPKDEIDGLKKGPPLESIITYARLQ